MAEYLSPQAAAAAEEEYPYSTTGVAVYSSGTLQWYGSRLTNSGISAGSNNSAYVAYAGEARSITVGAGGVVYVTSGGLTSAVKIKTGGAMSVFDGAYASITYVNGGRLTVSGGTLVNVQVGSGGALNYYGGTIGELMVGTNGTVNVYGGSSYFGALTYSGIMNVYSGTVYGLMALGGFSDSGGAIQTVYGGLTTDCTFSSYSSQIVSRAGVVSGTRVLSGAVQAVAAGGTAYETKGNGIQYVYAGGTTVGASVLHQYLSGGIASNAIILSDGEQIVSRGASAIDNCVFGLQTVESGAGVSGSIVGFGGTQQVQSGAVAIAGTTKIGGVTSLHSGARLSGNFELAGSMAVGGTVNASGTHVIFNLQEHTPTTADTARLDHLGSLIGAAYSVRVADSQAEGDYFLASGAAAFSGAVTVSGTAENTTYGVLNLGTAVEFEGNLCYLSLREGDLGLSVSRKDGIAIGNYSGGITDLAARTTGDTVVLYQNGEPWAVKSLGNGWQISGSGDFNGDGVGDFLLRYGATGSVGVWLMHEDNSNDFLSVNGNLGYDWNIAGTGDFNGDGADDILLANEENGNVGAWILDAGGNVSWQGFNGLSGGWTIAGTGDFNADNVDDILLYNAEYGTVGAWILDGNGNTRWKNFGVFDPGIWSIDGVGDFNGDGIDDILLAMRNENYQGAWLVNQETKVGGWASLGQYDTNTWSFSGVGDFNGDGTDDLLYAAADSDYLGARLLEAGTISGWMTIAS